MPKTVDGYSAVEATKITGVPYRTLDYWATTGFIKPSIANAKGRGTERRYAFDDLIALRVARGLRKAGVSVQALRTVVKKMRQMDLGKPLSGSRLIAIGSDVALVRDCDDIVSILRKPGQAAFPFMIIFDVARTVAEIREDIKALRAA